MTVGEVLSEISSLLKTAEEWLTVALKFILAQLPCAIVPSYVFFLAGLVGFILMLYGLYLRNQQSRFFPVPYVVGTVMMLTTVVPYLAGTDKDEWYVCDHEASSVEYRSVLTGKGKVVPKKTASLFVANDTLYQVGEIVSLKGAVILAGRDELGKCWFCHLPVFSNSLCLETPEVSYKAVKVVSNSPYDGRFVACGDEVFVLSVRKFPGVEKLLNDRDFLTKAVCGCKGNGECVEKVFKGKVGRKVELKLERL